MAAPAKAAAESGGNCVLEPDAACEGGAVRNIFDESEADRRLTWRQWAREQCNKANVSNVATCIVTIVGLVLVFKFGKDKLYAHATLSAGLFGLAGGVTNAIAVKMLFDTMYVAPGVPLVGSGIIEIKFKDIRRTLKNTMMKSFFVLDYMKGYIRQAVAKLPNELAIFLASDNFESLLSGALEKAASSEALKDVPAELRPLCHVLLEDLFLHWGQESTASTAETEASASKAGTEAEAMPSLEFLRPHLSQAAKTAAPLLQEQFPRLVASPAVLPLLRKEAEDGIRSSMEAQDPLDLSSCGGQARQRLRRSAADAVVGYLVSDAFPSMVQRAVSQLDFEQVLLAVANSDELSSAVDQVVRSKLGETERKADFCRRGLTALQRVLEERPEDKSAPWPPQMPLPVAKSVVGVLFETATPEMGKLPSMLQEKHVHMLRVQIDQLLEERLQSMSQKVVKRMVEDVMRAHCQWLVVWGNVFGGIIGLISALCGY